MSDFKFSIEMTSDEVNLLMHVWGDKFPELRFEDFIKECLNYRINDAGWLHEPIFKDTEHRLHGHMEAFFRAHQQGFNEAKTSFEAYDEYLKEKEQDAS